MLKSAKELILLYTAYLIAKQSFYFILERKEDDTNKNIILEYCITIE